MDSEVPHDRGGYKLAKEVTGLPYGTLYSMVAKRTIPHTRLGKRLVRFSRKALQEWLQANEVETVKGGI